MRADGGEQFTSSILCQSSLREHLESACFCFRSADIIHQYVESHSTLAECNRRRFGHHGPIRYPSL